MARTVLALALAALAGCSGVTPTQFKGDAKVLNGPDGCKAVCKGWGMELAGMVQMGEYSDGCICQVKSGGTAAPSGSAVSPSAAGVYLQMMAAAAAQHQMQMQQQAQPHPYVPGSPVGSPGWRPGLP
ncbi:MAG: hypothetical protein NVS2B9_00200 [Myxococcales bacterium]